MIFYNPDIYINDNDYVIGGFHLSDDKKFTNTSVIYFKAKERIAALLDEYIEEDILAYAAKTGPSPIINIDDTHSDACLMVRDYLQVETSSCTKSAIIEYVMESSQFQSWFSDIKRRFKYMPVMSVSGDGVASEKESSKSGISIERAKQYTNETTFAQLLEALALIEI